MANLIAIGSTASPAFVDLVVTTPVALFLINDGTSLPLGTGPKYELAQKGSNGRYTVLATLTTENIGLLGGLSFPATYGVRRLFTGSASGMDVG